MEMKKIKSGSVHPVDQVSSDAAPRPPAAQQGTLASIPLSVMAGICCVGFILLLFASTIVLSLIPVYLKKPGVTLKTNSQVYTFRITLPSGTVLTVGPYNNAQKAIVQAALQKQLDSNPATKGSTVTVLSATGIAGSGRRKRQAAIFVEITAIITTIGANSGLSVVNLVLVKTVISAEIAQSIVSVETATTTTVATATGTAASSTTTTTVTAATNGTRSLVRRSMKEGGAPANTVYIDAYQIAAKNGNVTSVSFYADQTCALATVEFGAFDLLHRDTDVNTAQLALVYRSGPLKLGDISELKPYMNLITIQLCGDKAESSLNNEKCQGNQFPILAQQYLGIYSDTCRLGFAPTPSDPVLAATWRPAVDANSMAQLYQMLPYKPSDYTILLSVTINSSESIKEQPMNEQRLISNTAPRVLFIGSYPPRECGLASFLKDLTENYPGPYGVVAMDEDNALASNRNYPDDVVFRLNQTNRDAYYTLADLINSGTYDIVNVQHEYSLFGGMAGEYVINLVSAIKKPVVTTLHTVPLNPIAFYLSITRAICALSNRVIVLSNRGRQILIDVYGIDEKKIVVVPHGVPDMPFDYSLAEEKKSLGFEENTPTMTTFGLIHQNKNIQLALKAMRTVVSAVPNMMYLVIGETHPLVKLQEGESYRQALESNITAFGLNNNVRFINKYMGDKELLTYLGATDVFITPYASEDQYVSGTLSWAVGLGKVVVSTPYLYAKDLLADGRGFLIPFNDHYSLSSLLIEIFQNEKLLNETRQKAYTFSRNMTWPVIGTRLQELFHEIISSS